METKFYCIVDRESSNPAMNSDGGDYDFGRTVAVQNGVPVAVRYWTSAEFEYCPHCGMFTQCEERRGCGDAAPMDASDVDGWEDGQLLTGAPAERQAWRFEQGAQFFQHFR